MNAMMDLQEGALMLLGPTMNAKVAFELSERLPHLPLRAGGHGRQPGDLRQVLHGLDHARQQDQMPVRGGARPAARGVAGGGTVFGVPRPRAARERLPAHYRRRVLYLIHRL